jgi:benzoyl-CoA-dihydrodiol lyase
VVGGCALCFTSVATAAPRFQGESLVSTSPRVDYQTHPSQYRHWKLTFDGPIATLAADFDENGGLRPGYKLKLNSYDLGVDIELADALNRIRFEHPEVRTVVITSLKDKVFCSGANIFMLGLSSHAWKVNFCKFTNETRNGIEDSSQHSGLKFLAAVNGSCAGGGYELALACDEILLVDDQSSAVSLPSAYTPPARTPLPRRRNRCEPHSRSGRRPLPRRRRCCSSHRG